MKKLYMILALVGILSISTSGRPFADDRPTRATATENASMHVSEHAVHYLEIVATDVQATSEFYANAYGWKFEPAAPELGNAVVAHLPGGSMCGIRAPMSEHEKPIVRTYLRVADLDAAVQRAEKLGATIAIASMEIAGRGKIAIYFIGGIEQGIWQMP